MKYIYKKYLPILKLKLNELIEVEVDNTFAPVEIWADPMIRCSEAGLWSLLEEGYLEKKQPREWWKICNEELGLFVSDYKTKKDALKALSDYPQKDLEVIKVKEVIDTD